MYALVDFDPDTADDNALEYDGPDLTPVKLRRMNTFTARQNIIMAAALASAVVDEETGAVTDVGCG